MRISVLIASMLIGAAGLGCAALRGDEESRVPLTAVVSTRGMISVRDGRHEVAIIAAGVNGQEGRVDQEGGTPAADEAGAVTASHLQVGEDEVRVVTKVDVTDSGISLRYHLTPVEEMSGGEVSLRFRLPGVYWHDAAWTSAAERGVIPKLYVEPTVFRLETDSIVLEAANRRLALRLSSRQW